MFSSTPPPRWLSAILLLCLTAALLGFLVRSGPSALPAEVSLPSPSPTAAPAPISTPLPTPEPTPSPSPAPDWSKPVPQGEAVDQETWFADAVFIGDSRTDGFHLYSGITPQADFLDHTGITVYEVLEGKPVIRRGDKKISILEALEQKQYGKVYISLGANELGYRAPQSFAQAYGELVDAVRAIQPDAILYIQSIIPVNAAKCKANDQPYYVTNESISAYNDALWAMAQEKELRFLNVSEALVDDTGQVPDDLSADGVHFRKEGYVRWLDYLTTHTGL